MNENLVHLTCPEKLLHTWSKRETEFFHFANIVLGHIDRYTIPQYGDAPSDEVESWSAEQCVLAIQKYTKRFPVAQRGRLELLRDLVKIAHFACLAFGKVNATEEDIRKIKEGKV